jgi:hypothetical protein
VITGPALTADAQSIFADQVRLFRQRALDNGYPIVRVRSGSKAPLPHDWQHGDRAELLLAVGSDALNTGMLVAGMRCIDCDIDDPQLVVEIMQAARQHLPSGALIRRRANSPRMALLYRAATGQPPKRVIKGPKGAVEILGLGQQVVIHGQHPSGAAISWQKGHGPDTVPHERLPAVSEEQISAFLNACAPLLGAKELELTGASPRPIDVLPSRFGKLSDRFKGLPVDNALGAGIAPHNWFSELSAKDQSTLLQACLDALDNRTSDPREVWLQVLFAAADAEQHGCSNARELALDWSRRGRSWTSEHEFDVAWNSFKPGGISVGSLLARARDAGLDLSRWRDAALRGHQQTESNAQNTAAHSISASVHLRPPLATPVANLPLLRKRQWLCGTYLVRGAVTVVYAPGGRAKTTWLITVALSCASGRDLVGAHVFGGPLTVLYWSVEDPLAEVTLRTRAGMKHHGLTDADLPGLYLIGADQSGLSLLQANGKAAVLDRPGWDVLITELDRIRPDVLIIDPLINVMGGVSANDNAAAALLMGKLVELAAQRRISIALAHHASKGRDPASAESAMGAVTFINLARIAVAIEPLAEKEAGAIGLPPWEAKSILRTIGTKQNLSRATSNDKYCRIRSVDMQNAEPPIYTEGDHVAVVEVFHPGASGPAFPQQLVRDALLAVDAASPPLSPSKNSAARYAAPVIAQAIASHRGGQASEVDGKAVLDHLLSSGLVAVQDLKFPRAGGRSDTRKGLIVTAAGKAAIQNGQLAPSLATQPPQPPQCPANTLRADAGGEPPGSPAAIGGYGGSTGAGRTARPSITPERSTPTAEAAAPGGAELAPAAGNEPLCPAHSSSIRLPPAMPEGPLSACSAAMRVLQRTPTDAHPKPTLN